MTKSRDETLNIKEGNSMNEIYPVPEEFKKTARTLEADYFERYQKSIEQPEEIRNSLCLFVQSLLESATHLYWTALKSGWQQRTNLK